MFVIAFIEAAAVAQGQLPDGAASTLLELLKQGGFATGMVIALIVAGIFYKLYKAERANNVETTKAMTAQAATVTTNEAKFEETARRIATAIEKSADEIVRLRDEVKELRLVVGK